MRVLVCGSRRWHDREAISNRLADLVCDRLGDLVFDDPGGDIIIVHGAAQGADKIAHQEAQKGGLLVEPHPADWKRYGKRAGYLRNEEMVNLGADLVIAFWDGRSKGTQHTMDLARAAGIPVEVVSQTSHGHSRGVPKDGSKDASPESGSAGESG